MVITSSSNKPS